MLMWKTTAMSAQHLRRCFIFWWVALEGNTKRVQKKQKSRLIFKLLFSWSLFMLSISYYEIFHMLDHRQNIKRVVWEIKPSLPCQANFKQAAQDLKYIQKPSPVQLPLSVKWKQIRSKLQSGAEAEIEFLSKGASDIKALDRISSFKEECLSSEVYSSYLSWSFKHEEFPLERVHFTIVSS